MLSLHRSYLKSALEPKSFKTIFPNYKILHPLWNQTESSNLKYFSPCCANITNIDDITDIVNISNIVDIANIANIFEIVNIANIVNIVPMPNFDPPGIYYPILPPPLPGKDKRN